MSISRSLARLTTAALVLLLAGPVMAQSSSTLQVSVTDSQGGALPGVTISVTNEGTKESRVAVTDSKGVMVFPSLSSGSYTVKAEIPAFKTREVKAVRISSADSVSLPIQLEVGVQTEQITVTADRSMINSRSGARDGLITSEQVESLSIIGRNPLELLRILPGVVSPNQGAFEVAGTSTGFGATGDSFSINGSRPEQLGVSLDGANLRDIGNNGGMLNVPNNEFIAEIKVQASNYAAEYGTNSISVQAVTKSGSSEFHGSLYTYVRPSTLSANDRSRNYARQVRPESKFIYPGGTLSGPIVIPGTGFNENRDKAFFFLGFEYQRQQTDPGTFLGITPTANQRIGLFNDYQSGQGLNQSGTVNIPKGFPGAGTPAPGNDLRPYMDPAGLGLMGAFPQPNYVDPNNRYNYVTTRLLDQNRYQGVGRFDYNISESTRAYVRLARDKQTIDNYRGLWWTFSGVETPSANQNLSLGNSAVLNVTSVLSPSTTNEFVFSWSKLTNDITWKDPSKMKLATYGAEKIKNPFGGSEYIPDIVNEFDTNRGSLWFAMDGDKIFSYNGFLRFSDNVTKVADTHAFKGGLMIERQYKQQNFQHQSNMQMNFAPWGNGSTSNHYGDLLVGRPAQVTAGQPSAVGTFIAWNYEAFVQDRWQVKKNLSIEYGVRFGKWSNNEETGDLGAIFLPEYYDPSQGGYLTPQRLNGVAYVNSGDVPRSLTGDRPLLWMPRANFAWDAEGNGKTILRGGAGIFFNREQGNAQYDVINIPPNSYSATLDAGGLSDFAGGQGLNYNTIGQVNPFNSLNAPGDINTVSPFDLAWPKTYNASLAVARRIFWRQTLEVGYVGAFGRNLAASQQQNVVDIGELSGVVGGSDLNNPINRAAIADAAYNSFKPYPTLGNVRYFTPIGYSDYHSLQTTLSREAGNFTYLVAYTLSKASGTVGTDFAAIDPLDPDNRSVGVLATDRRHNVTASWSLRLGAPAEGGFGKVLLNDWNLSGISSWVSGRPFTVGFQGDLGSANMARAWFGTSDFVNRADGLHIGDIAPTYTCDPRLSNTGVGEKILDVSCFGVPALGENGPTQSPYDLRLGSRSFHDLTIFKDIPLGGSRRIQLRAGIFNLFNAAYPDVNQGDIDLTLQVDCNVRVTGVPNGVGGTTDACDPTQGFFVTPNTLANFGKIVSKRGHRVMEFAVRLFF